MKRNTDSSMACTDVNVVALSADAPDQGKHIADTHNCNPMLAHFKEICMSIT